MAVNIPHKLNAKLLASITEQFYFTISYWYQEHSQALVICVSNGMWGDSQWNGDGCQTWGLGKIVNEWYLFSTFSKFLLNTFPQASGAITSCPSNSPLLRAIDFWLDVEVRKLIIENSSGYLNLSSEEKCFSLEPMDTISEFINLLYDLSLY